MKPKATRWPQKLTICLVLILISVLCLAPANAWAESTKATTVKVKITSSSTRPTKLEVGDDPSHTIDFGKGSGTAVFSDGKKAKYQSVWVWDVFIGWYAKGWGYGKFNFEDGSWILTKWQSEWALKSDKVGNPLFSGTGTIIKGSGLYENIKGTVTSTMRMLPPSKGHPNGIAESDAVWTYTLPSK